MMAGESLYHVFEGQSVDGVWGFVDTYWLPDAFGQTYQVTHTQSSLCYSMIVDVCVRYVGSSV